MNYSEFLQSKIQVAPISGFEITPEQLSPCLKPHQKDAVIWALRGGRRALFESFGGLATVPVTAVRMGRYGWGCELNSGYFADGIAYLRGEEAGMEQISLFDLVKQEENPA